MEEAKIALGRCDFGGSLQSVRAARRVTGFERNQQAMAFESRLAAFGQRTRLSGAWHLQTFDGHTGAVTSVAFVPNSEFALSGSADGTLRMWDVESGQSVRTFNGHANAVTAIAVSPDGRWGVSGSADTTVRLWNLRTGACEREFRDDRDQIGAITSVVISPDGRFALVGNVTLPPEPPAQAAMNRLRQDATLRLWDLKSGQCVRRYLGRWSATPGSVGAVAMSRDGRLALAGSLLLSLLSGRRRMGWSEFLADRSVCMSPDGRFVLLGGEDQSRSEPHPLGSVTLWDFLRGEFKKQFVGHTKAVESVAISPDCRFLLSGSQDKTVRLWDATTGQCIRTLEGHAEPVVSVAFREDGRYVLSASGHSIRLWQLEWELNFPQPRDWDDGALPYLEQFLTLQTPYGADFPDDRQPTIEETQSVLTRRGKVKVTQRDFQQLLSTLARAGYGWLRPEGVKKRLKELAAGWSGPPPLEFKEAEKE